MKGFLVLLVLSAAGLAGVLYWRRSLQATHAPAVAASAPAKDKDRHKRRRRGARRLGRNDVFVASAPPSSPWIEGAPSGERVPSGEGAPSEEPPPGRYAPRETERERAPLAPGGSATTEAAPSEVFGALAPSPQAPSGGGRREAEEPAPIKLTAADLRMVGQGEDLSKPEVTRLDLSDDTKELTQDDIDGRFRAKEDAVLGCIARARPDEYTYIPGQVKVQFRILKTGAVKGVHVDAPAILQKGGLFGCVRGVLGGLKFPASGSGQVVAYPFSLT